MPIQSPLTIEFTNPRLDTAGLIECMVDGLKIIRVLTAADETMRYNVWLRLIGAMPADARWTPPNSAYYRKLCSLIPDAIAAVATLNGEQVARRRGEPGIEFWRIVGRSGEPGVGIDAEQLVES